MSNANDGGPVLPEVHKVKRPNSNKTHLQRVPGMRLRDYIAANVLPQLVYDAAEFKCDDIRARASALANEAYVYADAMLAARGAA